MHPSPAHFNRPSLGVWKAVRKELLWQLFFFFRATCFTAFLLFLLLLAVLLLALSVVSHTLSPPSRYLCARVLLAAVAISIYLTVCVCVLVLGSY
ncbi:hypothetical protein DFJ73DRAFT_849366 [Zopfochytrium polystomum]|nr:hypothetical protein DFJ73DRAFT_849366 [Zopfochytrium polystomum]